MSKNKTLNTINDTNIKTEAKNETLYVQKLLTRFSSNEGDISMDTTNNLASDFIKQKLNEYKTQTSNRSRLSSDSSTTKENDTRTSLDANGATIYEKHIKTHFKLLRFITICGMKLNMNDISLATATSIYNKFFYSCDINQFDPYLIAASSIYLGSKIEEEHLKLRDVINVSYRTLHPDEAPLEIGETYWHLRNSITQCELLLVRVLEFKFNYEHPHKYLLSYLESLRHWIPLDLRLRIPVPETCWQILRDILHSNILLKHRPQEIAISIIYLVFMCYGIKVPFNDIAQKSWWKALDDKITRTKIHSIIQEIIAIYEMEEDLNLNNVKFT